MSEVLSEIPNTELGIEQIGDQSFKFKFVLFNSDDEFLYLRKGAIKTLELHDDMLKWYHYGYADISNPNNVLDKAHTLRDRFGKDVTQNFKFRNDNQMFIYFFIEPYLEQIPGGETLNSELFTMEFIFNVKEIKDIPGDSEDDRIKRLIFEDQRHYFMKTMMSTYTTAPLYERLNKDKDKSKIADDLTEQDGEVPTGLAIKDLLTYALGDSIKFSNFDVGNYTTQYNTPTDATYEYDLNILLGRHAASGERRECPCFLRTNRFVRDNEFSLIPLYDIFDLAYNKEKKASGPFMIERFLLSNQGTQGNSQGEPPKATTYFTDQETLHFPDYSVISDYQFEDVQNIVNSTNYMPRESHNYDIESGTFHVRFVTANQLNDEFKTNLSSKVAGSDELPYNTNSEYYTNEDRIIMHTTYSDPDQARIYAKNTAIQHMLFNGRRLTFTCKGTTLRRSTRFIGIEHPDKADDSQFDKKILGQHLVLRATHTFTEEGYTNTLVTTTVNNTSTLNQQTGEIT